MKMPASVNPPHKFQNSAQLNRAAALAEYIRAAKEDITVLDVAWEDNHWKGVGVFCKHGKGKGPSTVKSARVPANLLDPQYIDLAKGYVRERHLQNPGESLAGHGKRFAALRLVEAALLELHGSADPLKIDLGVLERSATLASKHFTPNIAYSACNGIKSLVLLLTSRGILPLELKNWTSPISATRNIGISVGSAGDRARQAKLPSNEALKALAAIFNRNLDPDDGRDHRDIYTTSVAALLLSAPSRGQEIHTLPVNLVLEETDRFGDAQTGLRLHASKGFGAYIKWVLPRMVPVAHKAIERLKSITEEARALARHLEDPRTCGSFFRHANCPEVTDNEPLTATQVCVALGLSPKTPNRTLPSAGLSSRLHSHTLDSLWTNWVLPHHTKMNPYFPYVSKKDKALGKKGGLKFSDALFCMRADQLAVKISTSRVILMMPSLSSFFTKDVSLSSATNTSIFDRYGYTEEDGTRLKMHSHQFRHLLNTEAQRMKLPDTMIAHWSGRLDIKQNETYDNRPEQERVDQVRPLVEEMDARLAHHHATDGVRQSIQTGPWRIEMGHKPRSCSDLDDIQPQLAGLKTRFGECHHDWAMAPCEGFIACIECREHVCIKGSDQTSQERLERIYRLYSQVLAEVAKAQAAVTEGNWGAQDWLDLQQRYATKLQQLITILKNPDVPDQSVIRLAGPQNPTHLHRVLRSIAIKAIEDDSTPSETLRAMQKMLESVNRTDRGVQPITVYRPKQLTNSSNSSLA